MDATVTPAPEPSLEDSIREVLNRHSAENGSNTPDFMLAAYLLDCLAAFDRAVNRRAIWYGHVDRPGKPDCNPSAEPSYILFPKNTIPDPRV